MHHETVTYNIATDNCHFCPLIYCFWHLVFVSILHHVQFVILHTTNYRTKVMEQISLKDLKKGDYFRVKNTPNAPVWVRGLYL